MAIKRVCIVGLGYIGLPTAAVIASRGLEVIGLDVNQASVDIINAGNINIAEPDLDIIVRGVVSTGNLRATTIAEPADVFMIAVPTPFTKGHKPDLSYIKQAAEEIAPVLEQGNLVILESTSPVGTTEQLASWLKELRPELTFPQDKGEQAQINVAHCPERVLPGLILQELVSNDRVIGGLSKTCAEKAKELYKIFVRGECILTTARTAEMAKLTENSFRDVNIAFANELSVICDKLKINVWELIRLANRHPRVNILKPGPGVGGHCIAVDPWFIVDSCPEEAQLIRQARETNDAKPDYVLNKICRAADEFKRPIIACLGITFKPDIDDIRESPALNIVKQLAAKNVGQVLVVEPNLQKLPKPLVEAGLELCSLEAAFEQANVVAVLVDHQEFRETDKSEFASKVVIDTRGIL
ncbi:UDP-N-acetyl-D-mannosamine dehydrogenase [Motilimonas eburnea]|uniref:UDP-N-acetyl-D-mannosamine dehydrogenase n=1 Tax=Motilimonas eburnea TaxID=1737488 RepID=UPI001E4A08FC|nr:UDP-N-acetyl-D-mannosamine dehydrogenase [Motilimonas eburnea]MCE2572797.1 UDP-N-acetyl-D-mannosamine dehydrogenase [Motilimonas eburnea]